MPIDLTQFPRDQTTGLPTFTTNPAWLNAHGQNVSLGDLPTTAEIQTGNYVCPLGSTPAVDNFTGHVYCVIPQGFGWPRTVPISEAARVGVPFLINAAIICNPGGLASAVKDNPVLTQPYEFSNPVLNAPVSSPVPTPVFNPPSSGITTISNTLLIIIGIILFAILFLHGCVYNPTGEKTDNETVAQEFFNLHSEKCSERRFTFRSSNIPRSARQ